ncbi:uncharacterized protein LOC131179935 isoform X2 [Hevea brasiliensis]|uniref:uncharacterized protein LOC131179935 isoform X2 n=1 Tax=Hevea brasiliensis TaxID=3981 RepID=UPI0025D3267B|nr:uncharacterized protein LOC131179935 isoform X2 [Hevea brasiliensis]
MEMENKTMEEREMGTEKKIVAVLLIVGVMLDHLQSVEPSDADCYDGCITACVQPNLRLMRRCEIKCGIKCNSASQMEDPLG